MGFTNVAWESRSTEQLAHDLTDGPGPMSVGQAGAAWVRIANELASVSEEYGKVIDGIKVSFVGQGADAATRRLEEFGQWLQAASLSAAGNGERAEEAAVANGVAVLAMPSVAEAVEAQTTREVMESLAAYNGAVLNGRFAELDESAAADQASASAVMYQYEDACSAIAAPWDQPVPPDVSNGSALSAERGQALAHGGEGTGARGGTKGGGAGMAPAPLTAFRADEIKSTGDPKALQQNRSGGGATPVGGMGGGYGPMAGLGRGSSDSREHESSFSAGTLDGGGEPGASASADGGAWLPAAQQSDAPFTVSHVSWGPDTSVFDELVVPDAPEASPYVDGPQPTLDQVSRQWVSPPVIGVDKGLTI
jgi:hypothetical protein